MDHSFGNQKITLACLNCGNRFKESVDRLQAQYEFVYDCPKCGDVNIFDTSQFKTQIVDADKAVEKPRKTIKKFSK
jgi:transcription initiation factor IIE alpha subunit